MATANTARTVFRRRRTLTLPARRQCEQLPELAPHVAPLWGDDALFRPLPPSSQQTMGRLGGGWLCRTDLEGHSWELVADGFPTLRLALDQRGDNFTSIGYRIELNLAVVPAHRVFTPSGADFGWRGGIYKVPERSPEGGRLCHSSRIATAVLFPREARIPANTSARWVAAGARPNNRAAPQADGATFPPRREIVTASRSRHPICVILRWRTLFATGVAFSIRHLRLS